MVAFMIIIPAITCCVHPCSLAILPFMYCQGFVYLAKFNSCAPGYIYLHGTWRAHSLNYRKCLISALGKTSDVIQNVQ